MDSVVFILNAFVGVVFVLLYSLFKPQDWSGERKRVVAYVLSFAVGIGVTCLTMERSMENLAVGTATVVAVSQLFYRLVMERFGLEARVRAGKTRSSA